MLKATQSTKSPFTKAIFPSLNYSFKNELILDGVNLSIHDVYYYNKYHRDVLVKINTNCMDNVHKNAEYLYNKIENGAVIYGVNTGFGGNADVRHANSMQIQNAFIRHLNVGIGESLSPDISRCAMLITANNLCRAMSGVRPEVLNMLIDMLNKDLIPVLPKRGSISASGDLIPLSYITGAMMGSQNVNVMHQGCKKSAQNGLKDSGLKPIEFIMKDALAVANTIAVSTASAALSIHKINMSLLLTQAIVALSAESLKGHLESFHPIVNEICVGQVGQCEVAHNIRNLLEHSKLIHSEFEIDSPDVDGHLIQDRYGLRTAPQWLGPAVETLTECMKKVNIAINSTNDNPVIDHVNNHVIHCGNFQGTAVAVAMDQTRQSVQLCGKLIFGLMTELINAKLNQGLPPNLAASDISVDFGFKGCEIAMASYCSELDYLTNAVTNHVLIAEMQNQTVNSLALLSARKTEEALGILHCMIASILCPLIQAIDLRYLQKIVEKYIEQIFQNFSINVLLLKQAECSWYDFAFSPQRTCLKLYNTSDNNINLEALTTAMTSGMNDIMNLMKTGAFNKDVQLSIGKGSRLLYKFIREDLGIPFYQNYGTPDLHLQKLLSAIENDSFNSVLANVFESCVNTS